MHHIRGVLLWVYAGLALTASAKSSTGQYTVKPFTINLSDNVPRMNQLISQTRLPKNPEYQNDSGVGIPHAFLTELKDEWTGSYNWDSEQQIFNRYNHFQVNIEGIDVHFIHEKSTAEGSIPILLAHGWPGSFHEFIPVIGPLTQPAKTLNGKNVSFDVVVPSLPGFTFSSAPPRKNWTVEDTGRVFNTLMTEVLGYQKYSTHGTDWGAGVTWSMYNSFNSSLRAAHLDFLPFYQPTPEEVTAANITLSSVGKVTIQRGVDFQQNHFSYFSEQTHEPNTIGFALYDSPVGQLSWIGQMYNTLRDPRAGTPPSVLNNTSILTAVSLYYLTETFISAAYIYAQNPQGFLSNYTKAITDAPLLFSNFEYNIQYWPSEYVEKAGNLVYFKDHDFGGHFAGLDNPPALIGDIRQIGDHFTL